MTNDLVISGRFYYQGKFQELMVGIRSGNIAEIRKTITGDKVLKIDGGIMPASTDTHVHFRDPGETEKEDFSTGSMSAIYGGTTTVMDMPNNIIPITDYERFDNKLSGIRGKSYCDYGLYSLYNGSNAALLSKKSIGIKIYLGGSTNTNGVSVRDEDIKTLNGMRIPVVFHAEDQKCLAQNHFEARNLREHNLSRPSICESLAIGTAMEYNLDKSVITHISDYNSIAATPGKKIVYEATPHHILLNDELDIGPDGKVNPPLRSREIQQNLLQHYLSGDIDIISSDHAPHTAQDKEEFQYAKSGIIGVETRVPLLLGLVSKHVLDLDLFYRTAIQNPASLFGLKKGVIDIGYRADFIAYRPSNMRRVNPERLHSKYSLSPFGGFDAIFPDSVIMGGNMVLDKGEIIENRLGNFLTGTSG
ncbi:MAG: dihydroorotase [Thermoplasmatales archaeon B_DKE]|nr:MAG: dihydroorotase [Thermoplasmatales archaeon B_DKE]